MVQGHARAGVRHDGRLGQPGLIDPVPSRLGVVGALPPEQTRVVLFSGGVQGREDVVPDAVPGRTRAHGRGPGTVPQAVGVVVTVEVVMGRLRQLTT